MMSAFDGHSEMVGLASEIGGEVIVLVLLKGVVAGDSTRGRWPMPARGPSRRPG